MLQRALLNARFTLRKRFTENEIAAFARLSGDSNPIHTGANGIVHGLLAVSQFSKIAGTELPGPGTRIYKINTTFHREILADQEVEVSLEITKVVKKFAHAEAEMACVQTGNKLISSQLVLKLP